MTLGVLCLTALVLIVAMVVEVILKDNLAGKEHLAAIVAVLVLCGVPATRHRLTGVWAGLGSGLPPIRSWMRRRGPTQRRSWR